MNLKDQILAKMQQNKLDRAKHQELVESLDRGLIYLQGQLDLVEEMVKKVEAEAKKAVDVVKDAVKTEAAKLEGKDAAPAADSSPAPVVAPAPADAPSAPSLSIVPDAPAADAASSQPAAPIELSPLPAAPDAPSSN